MPARRPFLFVLTRKSALQSVSLEGVEVLLLQLLIVRKEAAAGRDVNVLCM